jgi:uncharacterized protein
MKLHADQPNALNTVTAYDVDYVEVNRRKYHGSVIIMPQGIVEPWSALTFEALTRTDFERLMERNPELIVFGTGLKQRFPHPKLLAGLAENNIGVEIMNTQAACRTYNILMAEDRQVLAALLL